MQDYPQIGAHPGIPEPEYRSWKAFSITNGLKLLKSPGHYRHAEDNPREPTKSMMFGTAVHERLLEPEVFKEKYIYVPEEIPRDRRTKARKKWEEENTPVVVRDGHVAIDPAFMPKSVLETEDAKAIETIAEQVMTRDCCAGLLEGGENEIALVWRHDFGEGVEPMLCKGRLDCYQQDLGLLVDIKTTADASPEKFGKSAANYCYHIQLAHYLAGARALDLEIESVVIVAIESEEPYGVERLSSSVECAEGGRASASGATREVSSCAN